MLLPESRDLHRLLDRRVGLRGGVDRAGVAQNTARREPCEARPDDDNGDAFLNTQPDPLENDGKLAQIAYLDVFTKDASVSGSTFEGSVSPAVHELIQKLQELERSVFLLRNRKRELPSKDYRQQMETLLINLAKTNRDLKILRNIP